MIVLGSYVHSDTDLGSITLRINRGDSILYRSGPSVKNQYVLIESRNQDNQFLELLPNSPEWVILDFSNSLLPDTFKVRFVDEGTGGGEWSAIALRSN